MMERLGGVSEMIAVKGGVNLIRGRRPVRALVQVVLLATLGASGAAALPVTAGAQVSNPCDAQSPPPVCDSALGPLVDVTANWSYYQPALVQPIPISDYCPNEPTCSNGDIEDAQPGGAGWCGTETVNQPSSGPNIPPSTEVSGLPSFIISAPPPGKYTPYNGSPYCILQYIPDDFTPLCAGCYRVFLDYSAIPFGTYNSVSPASDGHWAGHFATDDSFSATTPFNGHSPNFKNLCSDKFINPAPGAGCGPPISQSDLFGHNLEGDSTIFHHYPKEGRYFNGPAYLAGTGPADYHWVNGAYFDVDPAGIAELPVWYNVGYRGLGDLAPDTDVSYGCLCEVPFLPLNLPGASGSGHTSWSPSLVLRQQGGAAVPEAPAAAGLIGVSLAGLAAVALVRRRRLRSATGAPTKAVSG
jgi:hypothetical protein